VVVVAAIVLHGLGLHQNHIEKYQGQKQKRIQKISTEDTEIEVLEEIGE
jgi:hypothetical protein